MAVKNPPPTREITSVTLEDMLANPQSIDWLWEEWIPQGTVAFLSGKGGMGKSLLAANLEIAIATGMGEFLGYPVIQGPVLHIGTDIDLKLQAPHYVASATGLGVFLGSNGTRELRYDDWRGRAVLPEDFDFIREDINQMKPVLVVFDSWAASFPYVNGNSARDVAYIMGHLKDLARMGPTVLVVDHTPKAADNDVKPEDLGPAGSHYKVGGSRASITMSRVPKGSVNGRDIVRLEQQKANLSDRITLFVERNWKVDEKKKPTAIYHTVIKDLQGEIGAPEDNQIMNLAKRKLGEYAEGLSAKDLVSKILEVVPTSESSVRRALRDLVKAKKIKETKTKGYKQGQSIYQLASVPTK